LKDKKSELILTSSKVIQKSMIKKRFLGAQSFINQFKMKESEYYYKRHSREEISGVKVRTFTLNAKF